MSAHSKQNTKNEILQAALYLFHTNGFDGTSIRDIAREAKVNSATISYYFKNKNGLLEYCFVNFLEDYIKIIENEMTQLSVNSADRCLISIFSKLFKFQEKNFIASRFIIREMSLDTMLNREILSTYMAKEKYYLKQVLEYGIKKEIFTKVNVPSFILQFKGLLNAPFINAYYAKELLHFFPQDSYYMDQYQKQCLHFIKDHLLTENHKMKI